MQTDLLFPQSSSRKVSANSHRRLHRLGTSEENSLGICKRPGWRMANSAGLSGVGKSTMALALASELAAELHKIPSQRNAQTIEDTVRQCWYGADDSRWIPCCACRQSRPDDQCGATKPALKTRLNLPSTKHNLDIHGNRHRAIGAPIPLALQSAGVFQLRSGREIASYPIRFGTQRAETAMRPTSHV